jgi:hypothetical protein
LEKARINAKEVCEQSGLSLMNNYADLFKVENNNTPESLFALQWLATSNFWGQGNTLQAYLACENFSKASDGWGASMGASFDMLATYDSNDVSDVRDTVRRNATFMTAGTLYKELYKNNGGYTYTNAKIASCKKYIIGSTEDAGVPVYRMSAPINTYMLRLADVYLTYAEAILGNSPSTNDGEALKYFNIVRQRYNNSNGMNRKSSITLDDIYRERRVEFAMEGQYWFDLVVRHYFQPQTVIEKINNQKRASEYTYERQSDGFGVLTLGYERGIKATDASMRLPYPEVDVISNPLLSKPPVPYYK